ncbi:hypothetical protein DFH01_19345 [Falsiroseomonas bella]|uniref:BLUF domain-containing protein n=2 Tax=Falsiroseomonas bella TaxID=2184016 RepID=A0A317FAD3_9PROT|nr:hypothetical protein DFH01_19345 [Falsiroseomonas bella]
MQPALRRVIYVSHTVTDPDEPIGPVLASILTAARRNNPRIGVTGALLYTARRFAQVLEGPPEAVEAIFETIQCDLRHDHVTVLEVSAPTVRAFADWSMAFVADAPVRAETLGEAGGAAELLAMLQAAIRNTEAATA